MAPEETHSQPPGCSLPGRRGQVRPPQPATPESVLALFATEMVFAFHPADFSVEPFLVFVFHLGCWSLSVFIHDFLAARAVSSQEMILKAIFPYSSSLRQ